MIIIKIHVKILHLNGSPLINNMITLMDARKLVVLYPTKNAKSSGILSAIMDRPASCDCDGGCCRSSCQLPLGGLIPAWKAMVAISDATTINAFLLSSSQFFFLQQFLSFRVVELLGLMASNPCIVDGISLELIAPPSLRVF